MAPPLPRLIVNLKTYPEATGKRAVALANAARRVERRTGVAVAVAPQAVDLRACAAAGARVWAQHADRVESSQSTGATRWESLLDAGIEGTLLNHSERRLDEDLLRWLVGHVAKSKIPSLVCAQDAKDAARLARLSPTMIAVEPPELIGGDVSVTTADPEIVRSTVRAVQAVAPMMPVLCGAGVKDGKDAQAARDLGSFGLLVASGVVKAPKPEDVMRELVAAWAESAATPRRA